jgi:hypothetical protein
MAVEMGFFGLFTWSGHFDGNGWVAERPFGEGYTMESLILAQDER